MAMTKTPKGSTRQAQHDDVGVRAEGVPRLRVLPPADVESLLRASDTLKGAASVVQQESIAQHAHRLEGLIGHASDATKRVPFDVLLGIIAAIESDLARRNQGGMGPSGGPGRAPSRDDREAARGRTRGYVAVTHTVSASDEDIVTSPEGDSLVVGRETFR